MSKLGKIYLILAVVSAFTFLIFRFLVENWIPFLGICIAGVALFIILAVWQDRKLYAEFFLLKTTKHGMSMGGLILTVLAVLAAVNFLAIRHHMTFDFSLAKVNSLSPQSIKLIEGLKGDLKVIYFYKKGEQGVEENRHAFIELMKKYQDHSANVKLEFVEVDERPDLAEQFGVSKGNGTVFLDYQGRHSQIQKIDEQEITSALVKVTREKEKLVYFLQGHGEIDIANKDAAEGGEFLKQMLEQNRYTVKPLSLLNASEVPKDADVIVILGSQAAFLENELSALDKYLQAGGGIVLGLKPKAKHNLSPWLVKYGVELKNNYVVNIIESPIGKAIDPRVTRGVNFSTTNPITKPFGSSQFVRFRLPQEVVVKEPMPQGLRAETLITTSKESGAAQDLNFKELKDFTPHTLAVFVTGHVGSADPKAPEMQLEVIGDGDLFGNQPIYENLNRDLMLNSLAYFVKEENLISITPKEVSATKMELTPTNFILFIFGFALVMPLAFLGASITLWFKRRYA